ncbi:hypothetical protein FNV62_07345 [Streptomyces sp. RLB3-17]|uniref:hypothetical protein n=1 Tax=Streptomyces sp. RLB3-17 TaxID=2594455 RepID=UPI0011654E1C|nr:hypothetical protein [Streptomyces sp. RLB3-17]QDO37990.1 hypothetical protein FNV62_07345 [Streptomyces sp. RLB3-17]
MATRTPTSVHHIGHLACGFRLNYIQEPANPPGSERTAQKIRRQEQGHQYAQEQVIALRAPRPRRGCDRPSG